MAILYNIKKAVITELDPTTGAAKTGGVVAHIKTAQKAELEPVLSEGEEDILRNDVSIKNWIGNKFDFKLEESYIERIRNIITLQSSINTLILDKMKNYMTIFSQICKSKNYPLQ